MTVRGHIRNGVAVPDQPTNLPEGAEVRIEVVTTVAAAPNKRQSGMWKGQVHIADDFDELPDDLAEAFGVRTP